MTRNLRGLLTIAVVTALAASAVWADSGAKFRNSFVNAFDAAAARLGVPQVDEAQREAAVRAALASIGTPASMLDSTTIQLLAEDQALKLINSSVAAVQTPANTGLAADACSDTKCSDSKCPCSDSKCRKVAQAACSDTKCSDSKCPCSDSKCRKVAQAACSDTKCSDSKCPCSDSKCNKVAQAACSDTKCSDSKCPCSDSKCGNGAQVVLHG